MALAGEWQACRKRCITVLAAIELHEDHGIHAVHLRAAVAEHDVQVAVVIKVARVAAHGAPASGQPQFAVHLREGAVAVVVIYAHGMTVGRPFAMLHRIDHIIVI